MPRPALYRRPQTSWLAQPIQTPYRPLCEAPELLELIVRAKQTKPQTAQKVTRLKVVGGRQR